MGKSRVFDSWLQGRSFPPRMPYPDHPDHPCPLGTCVALCIHPASGCLPAVNLFSTAGARVLVKYGELLGFSFTGEVSFNPAAFKGPAFCITASGTLRLSSCLSFLFWPSQDSPSSQTKQNKQTNKRPALIRTPVKQRREKRKKVSKQQIKPFNLIASCRVVSHRINIASHPQFTSPVRSSVSTYRPLGQGQPAKPSRAPPNPYLALPTQLGTYHTGQTPPTFDLLPSPVIFPIGGYNTLQSARYLWHLTQSGHTARHSAIRTGSLPQTVKEARPPTLVITSKQRNSAISQVPGNFFGTRFQFCSVWHSHQTRYSSSPPNPVSATRFQPTITEPIRSTPDPV
ncbi:hypothetical protein EV127DRAFT_404548 [Xylaria flabelliformis]|nr:hypothetical protein EV127DRAFT_404548 [Xylaria flabelliformis]